MWNWKMPLGIGLVVLGLWHVGSQVEATPSKPCTPPISGNWLVQESCTLNHAATLTGDLRVPAGVELTVDAGGSLDIDFTAHNVTVETGGRLVVLQGGALN